MVEESKARSAGKAQNSKLKEIKGSGIVSTTLDNPEADFDPLCELGNLEDLDNASEDEDGNVVPPNLRPALQMSKDLSKITEHNEAIEEDKQ